MCMISSCTGSLEQWGHILCMHWKGTVTHHLIGFYAIVSFRIGSVVKCVCMYSMCVCVCVCVCVHMWVFLCWLIVVSIPWHSEAVPGLCLETVDVMRQYKFSTAHCYHGSVLILKPCYELLVYHSFWSTQWWDALCVPCLRCPCSSDSNVRPCVDLAKACCVHLTFGLSHLLLLGSRPSGRVRQARGGSLAASK